MPTAILAVLVYIVTGIVFGGMCENLSRHKGYKGKYFYLGLLLGLFGFFYVWALPMAYDSYELKRKRKQVANH